MKPTARLCSGIKTNLVFVLMTAIFVIIVSGEAADATAEKKETILRLHGSNTIGAELAPDLAEAFLKVLGAASVNRVRNKTNTEITVEGRFPREALVRAIEIKAHGSATGFEDLGKGKCDIAMSSREIKESEKDALASLGDMRDVACEHTLALDGVAVIVNASNTFISTVDITTLTNIFSGKINNWARIGGKDASIHLHIRDSKSGTYDTFKGIVMGARRPAPDAEQWDSNPALSQAVSRDANAIGFCALAHVGANKALKVSDGGLSIAPTAFTIATEDYPITRRLHFYTPAEPKNHYTFNFIAFALGAGQQFITRDQFVPMTINAVEYAVDMIDVVRESKVFNAYINAVGGAKRLSTNYRFKPATHQLDSRAVRDLDRMIDFLEHRNAKKIILAGFTDNTGDYWRNYELSCSRVAAVKKKLNARGIRVHQSVCVGEEVPVASNATLAGQAKNRRVEVWMK